MLMRDYKICNREPVIRGLSTSIKYRLERVSVDRQEYTRHLETHIDHILDWVRSRSAVELSSDQCLVVDDALLPDVADGLRKESLQTLALANRLLKVLQDLIEENDLLTIIHTKDAECRSNSRSTT